MAPSLAGTIHPGADDNASGTAGVIELARWFATQPKQKRGILFLTFAGEELGLLGSSYYVNHPLMPLDNDVAMINMDMIGRVRDGKVFIGGVGTGSTLRSCWKMLRRSTGCTSIIRKRVTDRATILRSPRSRCRCCSSSPDCMRIITSRATPGTRSTRRMRRSCCSWWPRWARICGRRPSVRSSCG